MTEREKLINKAQICPYCSSRPKLTDSIKVYGVDYGKMWLCQCGAYVGCHPGTSKPLGRVADKELRILKMKCHELFDPLWKKKIKVDRNARNKAYEWMANELGIEKRYMHIGMLSVKQCNKMISICEKYYK